MSRDHILQPGDYNTVLYSLYTFFAVKIHYTKSHSWHTSCSQKGEACRPHAPPSHSCRATSLPYPSSEGRVPNSCYAKPGDALQVHSPKIGIQSLHRTSQHIRRHHVVFPHASRYSRTNLGYAQSYSGNENTGME